jgi:hypothetical protein
VGGRVISYREQVALALQAVAVRSATSYSWFGRGSRPLPRALTSAFPPGVARDYLIALIEEELYRSFYSQGEPVPRRPRETSRARSDPAFVETLSAANRGRGGWEAGWRVEAVAGPTLQLTRDGLRVGVRASECRLLHGERTGAWVSVRRLKEHRAASPGFYIALGDAPHNSSDDELEVRVYFNLTAAGAARLVAIVTHLLNAAAIAFNLKVLDHPVSFSRCDAAVLYLYEDDFDRVQPFLRAIAMACSAYLRGGAPAFAKPLAAGVAVGEHRPSLGTSFGTSRCQLVAEGIVVAHERGATRLCDRLNIVAQRFADRGIDLDVPYLLPGSADRYTL